MKAEQSTEQKILEAAKQVFLEKGLDGARMQDIADRAGINKALLHYYFRSKDKLFEMIFIEEARKFVPKMAEIMTSDLHLFEKIEQFVSNYIDMLVQNPLLPNFILNEVHRSNGETVTQVWGISRPPIDKVDELLAKLAKKGIIKPIKAEQLMLNMVSLCVFPFLAKPMVQWVMKKSDKAYMAMMEQRKTEVAKFIIDSIRK